MTKFEGRAIPHELTRVPRWVRWTYRELNGKRTKMPITVEGAPASTADPSTWTTYETIASFDRIGFVFCREDNLVGVDLDHVLDERLELCAWARSVVEELDSYTEVSPSGRGLHVIARGAKPDWLPSRVDMPQGAGLEVYDHGRYFTMSANVFEGRVELKEAILEKVFAPMRRPDEARPQRRGPATSLLEVSCHDVAPGYREGKRSEHPFHGSTSGQNFQIDLGGLTWRCWRHGCTGNALHLLGQKSGITECGERPTREQWRSIFDEARKERLVPETSREEAHEHAIRNEARRWMEAHGYA
jgi:hypothetical protein